MSLYFYVHVRKCDVHVRKCDVHVRECDVHVRECDVHVRECVPSILFAQNGVNLIHYV